MKRELLDISAELDGVSALVACLAYPYLEDEANMSNSTMGNALFAIQNYIDRIAADLLSYADERGRK